MQTQRILLNNSHNSRPTVAVKSTSLSACECGTVLAKYRNTSTIIAERLIICADDRFAAMTPVHGIDASGDIASVVCAWRRCRHSNVGGTCPLPKQHSVAKSGAVRRAIVEPVMRIVGGACRSTCCQCRRRTNLSSTKRRRSRRTAAAGLSDFHH